MDEYSENEMQNRALAEQAAAAPSLLTFREPPLEEVVLGVQFKQLEGFSVAHSGVFWSQIRDRYPSVEENMPLPHSTEKDEIVPGENQTVVRMPFSPRCWFISPNKNELIQLQPDQFWRNWRRVIGSEQYPRFSELSKSFKNDWRTFATFAEAEGFGRIKVDQCELTYINHIDKGAGWEELADLPQVFEFVRPIGRPNGVLSEPEMGGWSMAYKLPNKMGRLYVDLKTVFRGRDFKMCLAFSLRARGAPAGTTQDDMLNWFDVAHETIVNAFDGLTTPAMHSRWRKEP